MIEANDAALKARVATGLVFADVTPEDLQRAGMRADVGWDVSAAACAMLYRRLIQAKDTAP